ncbi:ScbA/BarX family gamma-butyrolactone biosynthesis protein [Pseudomonas abieticivorans]|uniref:ScbA/BarX family gamma-butyrolactone biosynthesis protein n=1 Tax=Pseudomonas abieticivorans TaxID=2931382 RepID=UPI0020BEB913|nr:ScbA/BarX family gamma-butyrolactone biosynthesis protein [Pseudomonas sp. PIA16]
MSQSPVSSPVVAGFINPSLLIECENTVPRSMVHRAAVSEVFLTGAVLAGEGHFRCMAQLPRTHSYFSEHSQRHAHYDMLLLLEVFRQASIYISHAFLNVSAQDKFIYLDSVTHVTERNALAVGERPALALIEVWVVDHHWRHGVRSGVTLNMALSIDGQVAARHEGMSIRWMAGAAWARMRARGQAMVPVGADGVAQLPVPMRPSAVARQVSSNVVLGRDVAQGPGTLVATLRVDRTPPAIFDHPLDHIPGMLLLEGFRQMALVAAQRHLQISPETLALSRCEVAFRCFGEFALPTQVRCHLASLAHDEQGRVSVALDIVQGGAVLATAALELLPVPARVGGGEQ